MVTKVSLYCGPVRVTRFLHGRRLGIPYAHSHWQRLAHWEWLVEHCRDDASVACDAGAAEAVSKGYSLFPVGISEVMGEFVPGDIISILVADKSSVGIGVTNFGSEELRAVRGMRSEEIAAKGPTHGSESGL